MQRNDDLNPLEFINSIRQDRSQYLYSIYKQEGIEGLVNYILTLNDEILLEFPEMVTEIIDDENHQSRGK